MLWYLLVFALIALVVLLKQVKIKGKLHNNSYEYRKKEFLLTRSEHEFYDSLIQAVGHKFYVFPQIHLDALANHKIKGQNWLAAFRHINEKSVDYVLCDKSYISPRLVIELDDSSHDDLDRQERDEVVEGILAEINLPLLRIRNYGNFNSSELARQIKTKLSILNL